MSATSVQHSTFVIQRELPARPRHAFRFWAEPALKSRWTSCHPDWTVLEDTFDFRVGGMEAKRWRTPDGHEQTFRACYLDLVPERRIIYAYEMSFQGARISASLVTIELHADGTKSRMTFTEQIAFVGSADSQQQRISGTEAGLDRLIDVIASDGSALQRVLS